MKKFIFILFFFAFRFSLITSVGAQTVSPFDFGLRNAHGPMGCYYVLYNTHVYALQHSLEVSYEGIDTLDIELPPNWKSIPLCQHTDFGGLVLNITNKTKHGALFCMNGNAHKLELDKSIVDLCDFRDVPELSSGNKLLVLNDKTPWTERRGYGYKQYRSDIIYVCEGIGINDPVAPWNTDSTVLQASYYDVDTTAKIFRRLTMHRTKESTFKTYCLSASGQYGLTVEDVCVTTPKSKMIADGVFSFRNCANLTMAYVTVDGTYSGYGSTRDYGYAFSMNNVWHSRFEKVIADGNWGVFGTNNMSDTRLYYCDINRFDIHCYGADAELHGCTLRQRQTQFSSMYGTVYFDSCRFIDCIPVRIRSSYNAYTPFDIVMNDCTFELTPRYHSLVNVMLLDTADNPRPELKDKCLPNLYVNCLTVVVPVTVGAMNLFHPTGTLAELRREFGYISKVRVNGINMVRPNGRPAKVPLRLSSRKFKSAGELNYEVKEEHEVILY